jgi:hypothetical protein
VIKIIHLSTVGMMICIINISAVIKKMRKALNKYTNFLKNITQAGEPQAQFAKQRYQKEISG